MRGICSCCKKYRKLEKWGIVKLCSECIEFYKEELPDKQEKRFGLKISEPRIHDGRSVGASYNVINGMMELREETKDIIKLCRWLSHEYTHFILHREFGLKACYQYDNLSIRGELDSPWFAIGGKR